MRAELDLFGPVDSCLDLIHVVTNAADEYRADLCDISRLGLDLLRILVQCD